MRYILKIDNITATKTSYIGNAQGTPKFHNETSISQKIKMIILVYFLFIIDYLSIISLPATNLLVLPSKSSFKYTSLALSCDPILQSVSIRDESSKNCKTFSAFKLSSVCFIKSTDSLNHSAIFIL